MNLKLFISTFFLIFLAELGDKTQLTAMARSASGDKWTVFFSASAALVCSTLVAVLFGSALTSFVPEKYIKLTAGGLFIVFGMLLIYGVFRPEAEPVEAEAATMPMPSGFLANMAFEMAAEFEESAAQDYELLARSCQNPKLRDLLNTLAAEERDHLRRVRSGGAEHKDVEYITDESQPLPEMSELNHDVARHDDPIIEHAIEHEKATAGFYKALAKASGLPSLKEVFNSLAAEEYDHARRLENFLESDDA